MLKIALTGNIACGKTTVENIIKEFSIPIIDADKIVNDLYGQHDFIKKVEKQFEIYNLVENEIVSKEKIAKIIFDNSDFKANFENFIHPIVFEKIQDFFELNKNSKYAIASVPLLFECNWQKYFDKIILITTDTNIQTERLMQRNNISKEKALIKINAQIPQKQKIELVDFVIDNNNSLKKLKLSVEKILKELNV